MKRILAIALGLCILPVGCQKTINAPTQPPAPGYSSSGDQTAGQTLAAIAAFAHYESTVNYPALTPAQQSVEKPYLKSLIDAVNLANITYLAFHNGTQTLAQAQAAISAASIAQNALVANKGVK